MNLRKLTFLGLFNLVGLLCVPGLLMAGGPDTYQNEAFSQLVKDGEPLYRHYCAHCHGMSGDADGFNADNLEKEPAELSDTKFISKKSNKQLYKVIHGGGRSVKKSHLMPVFGNTLSEKELWSLVAYVRYLADDKSQPVILPENVNTERPKLPQQTVQSIKKFREWFKENGDKTKLIHEGGKLFLRRKSCYACHFLEEEGGRVGPELSRAGFLYRPEWLFMWMQNPQYVRPGTKMPNIGMTREEAQSITVFLSSFKRPEDAPAKEWGEYLAKSGDPEKGKALFNDPEGIAYCAKCHRISDQGGDVGPDLSFVGTSRTSEFLLESILNPKAVITVGYSSVLILKKDGSFLTGVKSNEDEMSLDIVDKEGTKIHVPKEDIKKFKTQKISIMPGNFKDILSVEQVRDILAYLETLTLPLVKEAGSAP